MLHYVGVVAAIRDFGSVFINSSHGSMSRVISRRCYQSFLASAAVETESGITLNPELTVQILSRFQSKHGGRLWASSPEANTHVHANIMLTNRRLRERGVFGIVLTRSKSIIAILFASGVPLMLAWMRAPYASCALLALRYQGLIPNVLFFMLPSFSCSRGTSC